MRVTLRAMLAALALLVGPIVASAADLGGMTAKAAGPAEGGPAQSLGCQVGAGLGYSVLSSDTSTSFGVGSIDVNGLGFHSTEPDYGLHVGCDVFHVGGTNFVLGAFFDYNWTNQAFSASMTGLGTMNATINDNWSLGGRVGYAVGKTLFYIPIAYTHADMSWATSGPLSTLPASYPGSLNGYKIGAGIEMPIISHWSLALETDYVAYDSADITIAKGPTIGMKPDGVAAMARVNFDFGGDEFVKTVSASTGYQPLK